MRKQLGFLHETDASLMEYMVDLNDAYKYKRYAKEYIWVRCPACGRLSYRAVYDFVQRPTYCKFCCDGMSYPNKFMLNFLLQLGLNVEPEKIFDWSEKKRYDDYIESHNLIIENHGIQHYENINKKIYLPLEKQMEIDAYKKQLALNHDIEHYVEIDCRHSEMEWIRQSIMTSKLPTILSFQEQDIDWNECDCRSKKSVLIEACNLWNDGIHNTMEIASELHISRSTVSKYLKSGAKLGLCEYDPYVEMQKVWDLGRTEEVQKKKCKPVAVYNTIGIVAVFESAVQLSNESKRLFGVYISRPMTTSVCNGNSKTHVGLRLEFITKEEYAMYYNVFGGNVNLENFNPNIRYSSREKPIAAFYQEVLVDTFGGRMEAALVLTERFGVTFSPNGIVHVCLGQQKQHNGFIFKHITREEYERNKMNNTEIILKEVLAV